MIMIKNFLLNKLGIPEELAGKIVEPSNILYLLLISIVIGEACFIPSWLVFSNTAISFACGVYFAKTYLAQKEKG